MQAAVDESNILMELEGGFFIRYFSGIFHRLSILYVIHKCFW